MSYEVLYITILHFIHTQKKKKNYIWPPQKYIPDSATVPMVEEIESIILEQENWVGLECQFDSLLNAQRFPWWNSAKLGQSGFLFITKQNKRNYRTLVANRVSLVYSVADLLLQRGFLFVVISFFSLLWFCMNWGGMCWVFLFNEYRVL